jgi:hypothetical protein
MVVKQFPYNPPPNIYCWMKKKTPDGQGIRKQIEKFKLTKIDVGFVTM